MISYLDKYGIPTTSSHTWISMARDSMTSATEETDLTINVLISEIIAWLVSSVGRASQI